jgi:hypothetical protein
LAKRIEFDILGAYDELDLKPDSLLKFPMLEELMNRLGYIPD